MQRREVVDTSFEEPDELRSGDRARCARRETKKRARRGAPFSVWRLVRSVCVMRHVALERNTNVEEGKGNRSKNTRDQEYSHLLHA